MSIVNNSKKNIIILTLVLIFNISSEEKIDLCPYMDVSYNYISKLFYSDDDYPFNFIENSNHFIFKPEILNSSSMGIMSKYKSVFLTTSITSSIYLLRPNLDINIGLFYSNWDFYIGYFFNILKKEIPLNSFYSGIKFNYTKERLSLKINLQNDFSMYRFSPNSDIKKVFYSLNLSTKIYYRIFKYVSPYLYSSISYSEFAEGLTFQTGMGMLFGENLFGFYDKQKVFKSNGYVRKPNIYLYPTTKQKIIVKISPNNKIIKSIPKYENRWCVDAFPNGEILNTPGYLFYEAIVDFFLPTKGWCVNIKYVNSFLKNILSKYGLNKREIKHFLDYWSPILTSHKYYTILPIINDDIDNICPINIDPCPDNILRIWLIFKPEIKYINIKAPKIKKFNREGYVVTEWGGIIYPNM